jgi:hypothetical protein
MMSQVEDLYAQSTNEISMPRERDRSTFIPYNVVFAVADADRCGGVVTEGEADVRFNIPVGNCCHLHRE